MVVLDGLVRQPALVVTPARLPMLTIPNAFEKTVAFLYIFQSFLFTQSVGSDFSRIAIRKWPLSGVKKPFVGVHTFM